MAYQIVKKDELMHYGIKGQQKGVRRYQNVDGSLTREGMLRYGVGLNNNKPKSAAEYVQQQREAKKAQEKQRIAQAVAKTKATKVPVYNDGPDKPKLTQTSTQPLKQKLSDAVKDNETLKEKVENKVSEKAAEKDHEKFAFEATNANGEKVKEYSSDPESVKATNQKAITKYGNVALSEPNSHGFEFIEEIKPGKNNETHFHHTNGSSDSDWTDEAMKSHKRLGDSDFYGYQRPDGSYVVLAEDMKWEIPKGVSLNGIESYMENLENKISKAVDTMKSDWSNSEYIVMTTDAINDYIKSHKSSSIQHSDELMHYGILGMRWGVRRYQNPDGTLTSAGKRRYRNAISPDHYILPDNKQPYEISDSELQKRVKRIELENKYIQYQASAGQKFFEKYKTQLVAGVAAALSAATIALGKAAYHKIKDKINGKIIAKKAAESVADYMINNGFV